VIAGNNRTLRSSQDVAMFQSALQRMALPTIHIMVPIKKFQISMCKIFSKTELRYEAAKRNPCFGRNCSVLSCRWNVSSCLVRRFQTRRMNNIFCSGFSAHPSADGTLERIRWKGYGKTKFRKQK